MLDEARRRVTLAAATRDPAAARRAPRSCRSRTAQFDALTFTYLLRYVDDPPATLRELARVVRPGGTIAVLEFGVPAASGGRSGSSTCASACPAPGALISPGWHEVGRFLGPSIRGFYERWPLAALLEALARRRDRGRAARSGSRSAAGS